VLQGFQEKKQVDEAMEFLDLEKRASDTAGTSW